MQEINNLCMGCMSSLSGEKVCSVCGFDGQNYNEPNSLPLRTVLAGRYVVGKVLSKTEDTITYLSFDTVTESVVRITEYFPLGLCQRGSDSTVIIGQETAFVYNDGLMKFTELNKKLASFTDISAIYRIIDVFEVNNTVYSVTENPPGISYKEFLLRNGGSLTWEQVRPLILALINSINALHQRGVFHGAISPETLVVGRDGRLRMIDFCIPAFRSAESAMSAPLYPGFAAIEQYNGGNVTAATDVYAVGAILFRTLTGNPPPDAKQRLVKDNMTFSRSVAEQVPRGVLIAMANALRLDPASRTKTMVALREGIQTADLSVSATPKQQNANASVNNQNNGNNKKSGGNKKYILIAALVTILLIGAGVGVFYYLSQGSDEVDESSSSQLSSYESYNIISASSTPEKYMSVPDFSGKSYAELMEDEAYEEYAEWFDFKVVRKEYNDKYSRGKICAQSVKIGTAAKKGTVVEFTVSLGPDKITIPRELEGMNKDEAVIEMLKRGVDFNNIHVEEKMGEETDKQFIVIETVPAMGEKISPDESITIYYNNNYKEPEPDYQDYLNEYLDDENPNQGNPQNW